MNCLTEAIGLALPGNGSVPAVMSARTALAKISGRTHYGVIGNKIFVKGYSK